MYELVAAVPEAVHARDTAWLLPFVTAPAEQLRDAATLVLGAVVRGALDTDRAALFDTLAAQLA